MSGKSVGSRDTGIYLHLLVQTGARVTVTPTVKDGKPDYSVSVEGGGVAFTARRETSGRALKAAYFKGRALGLIDHGPGLEVEEAA